MTRHCRKTIVDGQEASRSLQGPETRWTWSNNRGSATVVVTAITADWVFRIQSCMQKHQQDEPRWNALTYIDEKARVSPTRSREEKRGPKGLEVYCTVAHIFFDRYWWRQHGKGNSIGLSPPSSQLVRQQLLTTFQHHPASLLIHSPLSPHTSLPYLLIRF